MWDELAFTMRLLRKSPIFTAAIVLTLALGVGVNTAIFSVVNALILRPLPVRDGNRLVVIANQDTSDSGLHAVSFSDLQDYRAATIDVFEDVTGYNAGFMGLAREAGRPERVLVTEVTGSYFPLLDIRPALGRLIQADEVGSGRTNSVVVLGHSTWQRRFGGDRAVVGKIVRVNGQPCTIVGVAPPDFAGTFAFSDSELYLPLNWRPRVDLDKREARGLHAIARLRSGVTIETAQAAMNVVAERLARQYPDSNSSVMVRVVPERLARPEEDQYRTNAQGATIMLVMVGLVMITAVGNVTNLLLARATSRLPELAIRAALGAGRARLVRQMVTESLVLAALGGSVGWVLGTWTARALATIRLPGDLPVRFDFEWDGRVLAYTVSVAVVCGLLVGLVPAMRISGADLDYALRQSRYGSAGVRGRRIRGFLVSTQIAVSFALLVAAGLFARSMREAERADLGFRPEGVLNVHMDAEQLGFTEKQGRAFFEEVDRRVRSIPGVQSVSFAFTIPMGYIRGGDRIEAEGRPVKSAEHLSAGKNIVSPEYFQTMGIPLVKGRIFSSGDDPQSPRVAIVNQQLADIVWPGRDPIGQRFSSGGSKGPWIEVVGVTNTGKYESLLEAPQPYFYVPIAQEYTGLRVLQVRSPIAPEALAPAIEQAIRTYEPNLPLYDVQPMTQALGSGLGFFPVRVAAFGVAALGLLASALAIVGVYGVVSYLASQRRHEIGIRMAVGATRYDVERLVLLDGLHLVVFGLAGGLVLILVTSRVVGGFLFGISPRDPLTLLGVAAILGCVGLIACGIPAWRAARIDPTVVLRSE